MKLIRKAIFPVGGLGTRFLPVTKALPKEMLPVVDRPLIEYAIEEAHAAGIEQMILVTGRGKSAIEDYFDRSDELESVLRRRDKVVELQEIRQRLPRPGAIAYTRQQEPLGLGHAILCARDLIGDEPFAVLLADDLIRADVPCLRQMIDAHAETGGNMVAVMDVSADQVSRYGVVGVGARRGRLIEVNSIVEKPRVEAAPSTLAVIGRYILQPGVFRHLERTRPGAGGEIQLTDAIARMIGPEALFAYCFEGTRFDCGDKLGYLEANIAYALDHPELGAGARDLMRRYQPEEGEVVAPMIQLARSRRNWMNAAGS